MEIITSKLYVSALKLGGILVSIQGTAQQMYVRLDYTMLQGHSATKKLARGALVQWIKALTFQA